MPIVSPNCWTWDVDPVLLHVAGPLQVRWYGLAFLAVFLLGFVLLRWQMERCGRGEGTALGFVNYGIAGLLGGAWIAHRVFYDWERLRSHPLTLLDFREGLTGLSSHGAALGLMAAMWVYARRAHLPFGEMLDRFSFSAAAGAALVRLGNFFNSEVVGAVANDGRGAWWAVCFPRHDDPPVPRHPSQLYEVAIGVFVLGLLFWIDRHWGGERRPRWLLAGTFLVAYFSLRFMVEFVKAHQVFAGDATFDMGHLLSLPFLLVGIGFVRHALVAREPACGLAP